MAVIAEIGRIIGSSLEIEEVYERFAAEARKLIPFDRLAMSLHNFRDQTVRIAYMQGKDITARKWGRSFLCRGRTTRSSFRRERHSDPTGQVRGVRRIVPSLVPSLQKGLRSLLSVPLISRDVVIGGLHFWSEKPHAYKDGICASRNGSVNRSPGRSPMRSSSAS